MSGCQKWGRRDSNPEPTDYESALPSKHKGMLCHLIRFPGFERGICITLYHHQELPDCSGSTFRRSISRGFGDTEMTTANWSAAARKLTWQPGAGGRGGRWKKVFGGFTLYYVGGEGRDDAEAHSEATYRCWIDLREIAAGRQPPSKLPGGWDAYDEKLDRQTDLQRRLRISTDNWTREPDASPAPVVGETIANVIESYLRLRQRHVRAGVFRPKSYAR